MLQGNRYRDLNCKPDYLILLQGRVYKRLLAATGASPAFSAAAIFVINLALTALFER
jgi:hypothetical protein